ncbi:MAG TPA: winged helix DNA-binding domain-containing protein [Solirubrobacteraceae bacterium]|nr:winged helix DNA-binding domain-containing protein [Solirubrobacteraceae bacterium]
MRTLSRRELNRALLARQLLLERGRMPLARALERAGGIQAQYAPSMYVGLWTRLEDFERDALTAALERRSVVQATLMRSTIHLVSRGDYWPFALATREARRTLWRRSYPGAPSAAEMAAAAKTLRRHLAGGALGRKAVEELLGKPRFAGVGLWLDLVRVPPSGTWERRRADLFAAAADWLGEPEVDAEAATEHLVRRYLAGFGPASAKDVASFTGLPAATLQPVLERLSLRRFRSEEGEELLDLPRAPLPDPETPAPPRFLPTWDATLLVHARRTGVLPEEHRPKIFSIKNPHSLSTFLVDGAVAGSWKHERGEIRLDQFGPLDAATRRALREEADRLADFHA